MNSGMENLPSRGHNVEKYRVITGMENLPSSDQDRQKIGGVISGMENLPSRDHIVERYGGITGMENLPSSDPKNRPSERRIDCRVIFASKRLTY